MGDRNELEIRLELNIYMGLKPAENKNENLSGVNGEGETPSLPWQSMPIQVSEEN